jgi:hypothetical protein
MIGRPTLTGRAAQGARQGGRRHRRHQRYRQGLRAAPRRSRGDVQLVARTVEKLDETLAEIAAAGGTAQAIPATSPAPRTANGWWPTCCASTGTSTS